jgi:hypothetical protein
MAPPSGVKLKRCPKGEYRDKATYTCVKKTRKINYKELSKKLKRYLNTLKNVRKKASPKKISPKKASPNKITSNKLSHKTPMEVPGLSHLELPADNDKAVHSYHKDYLKDLLKRLIDKVDSFEDKDKDGSRFTYYNLEDLNTYLEKEMNTIEKNHEVGEYVFPPESRKVILEHLKKYKKYFKEVADEEEGVHDGSIIALYK